MLDSLRTEMKKGNLDAYIVPETDPHHQKGHKVPIHLFLTAKMREKPQNQNMGTAND